MSQRPSSSTLLQLIDALNRCVAAEQHTRILADALQRAGLVELPPERDKFRAFATGALAEVVTALCGEAVASELTWILMRATSVRAPSSRRPGHTPTPGGSDRYSTAAYTEDLFAPRTDVMLIDPDDALFEELRIHLDARGYGVVHVRKGAVDDLESLSRDAPPRLVIVNFDVGVAFAYAERCARELDERAPPIVVLSDDDQTAPPTSVERVVSGKTLAPIVELVVALLGERS